MSVANRTHDSLGRSPGSVFRALIVEARRRARRRRGVVLLVVAAGLGVVLLVARDPSVLGSARAADTKIIPTRWVETQTFANNRGAVRLYVRKLEFFGRRWRAAVGLTNLSKRRVDLLREQRVFQESGRPDFGVRLPGAVPITFIPRPGIRWDTYENGTTFTHFARTTSFRPRYPTALGPRKSWFGVFTGTTTRLPKGHLLRVGYGVACLCPESPDHIGLLSTNHQFRLPRR